MKCSGYVQTTHMGQEMNSCLKCGRTLEAHKRDEMSPEEEAREWMIANGFGKHPLLGLGTDILARYLKSQRR